MTPSFTIQGNVYETGDWHNYLIGGNICNAFAVGDLESPDDFFLVGAEPTEDACPLLTGNILDSEGNLLCRLVRNVLTINPANCALIHGDLMGYEIHDAAGAPIIRVRTQYRHLHTGQESWVTTLEADFYDRHGNLVFRATAGGADERIESSLGHVIGFGRKGGFSLCIGLSQLQQQVARLALATKGKVYQLVTGRHENETINLDGKLFINADLFKCELTVHAGDFRISGGSIRHCRVGFGENALAVKTLYKKLIEGGEPPAEGGRGADPGWLADDELTRDWRQLVEQYRSECDASERRRLLDDPAAGGATS